MARLEQFLLYSTQEREQINRYLGSVLYSASPVLGQAMRYSGLCGGKRLRGIACMLVYTELSRGAPEIVLPIAAGIECIHTMSLIHDDMPCMDDDDLRRGQPTCHKKFDEATALLTGDALLIEGVNIMLRAELPPATLLQIVRTVMHAIGAHGMTAGQALDMYYTSGADAGLDVLSRIHSLKTGIFFRASMVAGAIAASATTEQVEYIGSFAEKLGLAFQIIDDILDIQGDQDALGKTLAKDIAQDKMTFPRYYGLDGAMDMARTLYDQAQGTLGLLGLSDGLLAGLAQFVIERRC